MCEVFSFFCRDPFDDGDDSRHQEKKISNIEVVVNVNDNAKKSSITNHQQQQQQQQRSPMLSFASPRQLMHNHSNNEKNEFRNLEPLQSPSNNNNRNNNNSASVQDDNAQDDNADQTAVQDVVSCYGDALSSTTNTNKSTVTFEELLQNNMGILLPQTNNNSNNMMDIIPNLMDNLPNETLRQSNNTSSSATASAMKKSHDGTSSNCPSTVNGSDGFGASSMSSNGSERFRALLEHVRRMPMVHAQEQESLINSFQLNNNNSSLPYNDINNITNDASNHGDDVNTSTNYNKQHNQVNLSSPTTSQNAQQEMANFQEFQESSFQELPPSSAAFDNESLHHHSLTRNGDSAQSTMLSEGNTSYRSFKVPPTSTAFASESLHQQNLTQYEEAGSNIISEGESFKVPLTSAVFDNESLHQRSLTQNGDLAQSTMFSNGNTSYRSLMATDSRVADERSLWRTQEGGFHELHG